MQGGLARDRYDLYDYVRATAAKLAAFDSFYVGLLHGANRVRFPYGYEGSVFDDPTSHTYGPSGPTAWLVKNRQTYRFAYDNGAVLNAGVSFGDTRRRSADAVTVPMFRTQQGSRDALFGMVSMHSYTPGAFDDNAVRAFEWLTGLLARVLTREKEDTEAFLLLLPGGGVSQTLTSDHVMEHMAARLSEIHGLARRMGEEAGDEGGERGAKAAERRSAEEIVRLCEQTQTELMEMALWADEGPEQRFLSLTEVEQKVAVLLVDGLGNRELANEIGRSPNTVKVHLKNIYRKYGMTTREQVAEDVRKHLAR
ncbi:helix-turn-helix transcriptional regulator [Streptomyces ipomoeae]|uniref:Helix-turn-helix transcriptional regulator n=1 Tax=Streptomyces ipomoeae TaxID=103232 RepID=A0AAE8W1F6_9ACTN|nr:LuxR C-terminal-related transcriptional regulator [Streptomyces ipomoeae]TQE32618.1 helix-turn-helix transcriptional regulator [Streptomyces ipomoeae]